MHVSESSLIQDCEELDKRCGTFIYQVEEELERQIYDISINYHLRTYVIEPPKLWNGLVAPLHLSVGLLLVIKERMYNRAKLWLFYGDGGFENLKDKP